MKKSSGFPLFKISGKNFGFCTDISFAKSDIYHIIYQKIMNKYIYFDQCNSASLFHCTYSLPSLSNPDPT